MTEEVIMIPRQEFESLQDYYKGKITQSALLNKAGRLAAEKHMILKNPKIPSDIAVKMVKPLSRQQARLTNAFAWVPHRPWEWVCPTKTKPWWTVPWKRC